MRKNHKTRSVYVVLALVMAFFNLLPAVPAARAAGANLFLSPATGTYGVGDSFTVAVMVKSGGGAGINASEATLTFDKTYLNVVSLSQTGSIFELWTAKPSFSNNTGKISYGGGLPDAYKGSAGKLFSVTFRALKAGSVQVPFSNAIVTASDGLGTNVFAGASAGSYTITEKQQKKEPVEIKKPEPTAETTKSVILPPAPEITSSTHPNQDQWYGASKAIFDWKILSSITGVSTALNESENSDPGPVPEGVIQTKTYENLTDGKHYFHLKLQNKGGWGPVAHRQVLVDTEAPARPKLDIDNGGDPTNPSVYLKIATEDKTSGLAKFKINLNNSDREIEPRNFIAEPYAVEKLSPGRYSATVAVYDRAGNLASSSITFTIDPLKAPVITDMPRSIKEREQLIIRGASFYPDATLVVFIGSGGTDPMRFEIKTDENGDWNYFQQDRLKKGNYEVWARIVDSRGAESLPSTKQFLTVVPPEIIATYGLLIILLLIFIIILLLLYIIILKKRFREEKQRILEETLEARKKIDEVFVALQEEVDELIVYADKRPGLSESEKRVKEKIKEALDISEEFLDKEVEDIEKEVTVPKKKK